MKKIITYCIISLTIITSSHDTYAQTYKRSNPIGSLLSGVASVLSSRQESVYNKQRKALTEAYMNGNLTSAEYAKLNLDIDRNELEYKQLKVERQRAISQEQYQQKMLRLKRIQQINAIKQYRANRRRAILSEPINMPIVTDPQLCVPDQNFTPRRVIFKPYNPSRKTITIEQTSPNCANVNDGSGSIGTIESY